MFENIKFIYVAPPGLELPQSLIDELAQAKTNVQQVTSMTLEEAIGITDVLYVTRIQKERFESEVTLIDVHSPD